MLAVRMFCAAILTIAAFSVQAQTPTVVQISILEHQAFTPEIVDDVYYYLKEKHPNHYVHSIAVDALTQKENTHLEVARMLNKLDPDSEVTHLIIETHGGSMVCYDGSSFTSLEKLGGMYENRVSSQLAKALAPIRNKASKDLHVTLNACSTMVGKENIVAKRAKSLLEFFNAPNGKVYGATLDELSTDFSPSENTEEEAEVEEDEELTHVGYVIGRTNVLKLIGVPALISLSSLLPWVIGADGLDFNIIKNANYIIPQYFSVTILSFYLNLRRILKKEEALRGKVSQLFSAGRLFHFNKGELSHIESVSRKEDLEKIYGFMKSVECEQALSEAS